ncbi:MAG: esterase/lipase family protein [Hyphomonadaceae bacterium]
MENEARVDRIAIVTIHGTGDTAEGPDGEKWFQNGSAFAERLKQNLVGRGLSVDILPHLWSGANSSTAREAAAESLAKSLKQLAKRYGDRLHLVGHSHGGNVANDAATILNWSPSRAAPIASVSTVGTPFFRTRITQAERIAALIFFGITALSALLTAGLAIAIAVWISSLRCDADGACNMSIFWDPSRDLWSALPYILGVSLPVIISFIFILPMAWRGVRRVLRFSRKPREGLPLLSIWHPSDEAISFLQRVERLPIQPFPRWSLWRGSRFGGVFWGVVAAMAVNVVALLLLASGGVYQLMSDNWEWTQGNAVTSTLYDALEATIEAFGDFALPIVALGLAGTPVVFVAAYLAFRLLAGLLPDLTLRSTMNGSVRGALVSMAFGKDGDQRLCELSSSSHYFGGRAVALDGEVAQRMQQRSADATRQLFERYRWALFGVGVQDDAAIEQLAIDALTWDSLIHTIYFDQPEMADIIAEHVAETAQAA